MKQGRDMSDVPLELIPCTGGFMASSLPGRQQVTETILLFACYMVSCDFSAEEFAHQHNLFLALTTPNFCGEWEHLSKPTQMQVKISLLMAEHSQHW